MVEMMHEGNLREWLKDKPQEIAVAIAARSALRSAPFLSLFIGNWPQDRNLDDDLSSWLRCIITSGVAGTCPTPEVKRAAFDAAAARAAAFADAAAAAFADAAVAAARAAAFAAADAAAVWDAVTKDVKYFEENGFEDIDGFMARPIWPDGVPNWLTKDTERFLDYLASKPELSFWGPWYIGMRDGNPPDWEMQEKIVLIPNGDWEKGAKHVSGEIARIEAEYLAKATPFAENVEWNETRDELHLVPVQLDDAAIKKLALDKISREIKRIGWPDELKQHHLGLEPLLERLTEALSEFADHPQMLHDELVLIERLIRRLTEAEGIADDVGVEALRSVLDTSALDIRRSDEDVKKSYDGRVDLRLREMSGKDEDRVVSAGDAFSEIADANAGRIVRADAAVTAGRVVVANPEDRIGAAWRTRRRVPQAYVKIREEDERRKKATDLKGKAVEKGAKTAKGLAIGHSLGNLASKIEPALQVLKDILSGI